MRQGQRRAPQALRSLRKPGFEVELAVSPLAGMKGAAGYHSSILIAAEEYFFSPMGIIHSPTITSHKNNSDMQLFHMGLSNRNGADLIEFMDQYFPPGHYDLLRKNCNSFSDCALYFLCEQRLDWSFRTLERFGKLADDHAGIIQSISGGEYTPNPRTVDFDVEAVIEDVKELGEPIEIDMDVEYTARDQNVFARDDLLWNQGQQQYEPALVFEPLPSPLDTDENDKENCADDNGCFAPGANQAPRCHTSPSQLAQW